VTATNKLECNRFAIADGAAMRFHRGDEPIRRDEFEKVKTVLISIIVFRGTAERGAQNGAPRPARPASSPGFDNQTGNGIAGGVAKRAPACGYSCARLCRFLEKYGQGEIGMQAAEKHEGALDSYRRGELEAALSQLGEALQEQETSERWNDWATVLLLSQRHAEAEVCYRQALHLERENKQAAENLGMLLASSGRTREAIRCLESAGERSDSVEQLLAHCREAVAKQPPDGAAVERVEQRMCRALAIQSSAVANLLLRANALENAFNVLAPGQVKASARVAKIIPTIPASEILADSEAVESTAVDATHENVTLYELCLIVRLCEMQRPRSIFEIGTADGRSTINLAAAGGDAQVFTLNPPRPNLGSRFQEVPLGRRITQLIGDSSVFAFAPFLNSMDFIFIDANHHYEYVRRDSQTALRLLSAGGGTIVWHDYIQHWPGVMRTLNELFVSRPALAGMKHVAGTSLVYVKVSHGFDGS
jgi:predicted O-methyltransferase YrrM